MCPLFQKFEKVAIWVLGQLANQVQPPVERGFRVRYRMLGIASSMFLGIRQALRGNGRGGMPQLSFIEVFGFLEVLVVFRTFLSYAWVCDFLWVQMFSAS